jgi:hypothetical protein
MAGGIDWLRWHHGSVTDPKFQLVAKRAGVRLGDVMVVWAFVLEKASADADRGSIGQIDFDTLDYLIGGNDGDAIRILDALTARGLIEGNRIANWEKRQPKREREDDTATERKRRQRDREAEESRQNAPDNNDVTPRHTMSHQETPRGEERREEEEKPISEQPVEVETSPPAKPAATASRGSRLPADWQLPKPWGEWALDEKPGWTAEDVRRCAEKFRDHWIAATGRGATKADWMATWRNWVRNEKGPPARASPGFDARSADRKRAIAELTGVSNEPRIEREINPAIRLASSLA